MEKLLAACVAYGHTQGALLILRQCASWGKLVYSARTVPPELHVEALKGFNQDLRQALEQLIGGPLPDRSWSLAQLGIKQGGLGFR